MLEPTTRAIVAGCSILIFVAGIAALAFGGVYGIQGLWAIVIGGAGIIAITLERRRYRSESAERSGSTPGPGGGEDRGSLEPRFRRTEEAFVDPPSGKLMRVYVDPSTGERRYVAEG